MQKKTLLALLVITVLAIGLTGCTPAKKVWRRLNRIDPANAPPQKVSMNRKGLPNAGNSFRFLVVGHLYGSNSVENIEPSQSLLDHMDELRQADLRFMVLLGDSIQHAVDEDFDRLEDRVLQKVDFPVFNTVGNHDVNDRALYESRYGANTYYAFRYGPAELIFLDTERETCTLDQPQREMLKQAVQSALADEKVSSIFVFMHKTLFFQNETLHQQQKFSASPNQWICYGSDFSSILDEILRPAALRKPVYLFAGDVGAQGNLSPYYEEHPAENITMVMTGLGEKPNDAGILVTVENDQVKLELYPLTDDPMLPLEEYTPDYWINVE